MKETEIKLCQRKILFQSLRKQICTFNIHQTINWRNLWKKETFFLKKKTKANKIRRLRVFHWNLVHDLYYSLQQRLVQMQSISFSLKFCCISTYQMQFQLLFRSNNNPIHLFFFWKELIRKKGHKKKRKKLNAKDSIPVFPFKPSKINFISSSFEKNIPFLFFFVFIFN